MAWLMNAFRKYEDEQRNRTPCNICRNYHYIPDEKCWYAFCTYCEMTGHLEKICKQKKRDDKVKTYPCSWCKKKGHLYESCHKKCRICTDLHNYGDCPLALQNVKCMFCNNFGHVTKQCHKKKEYQCKICNKYGHAEVNCYFRCKLCNDNESCHLWKNCTNKKRYFVMYTKAFPTNKQENGCNNANCECRLQYCHFCKMTFDERNEVFNITDVKDYAIHDQKLIVDDPDFSYLFNEFDCAPLTLPIILSACDTCRLERITTIIM